MTSDLKSGVFLCLKEGEKMSKETKIGSLVIDLQVKTAALESGLKIAQKKLQEMEKANKDIENSNKSTSVSWIAMAGTATAALVGIKSAISDCITEYNAYTQSMSSLQNVSDYTGQSMSDMTNIMDKYSSVMNKSDLATTIKNFSLMGFTVEQTDEMIQALTNSAIRNRNANYTVSEAVRVASEGYRQGLSTLSDSAGVTENLSVMQEKYAQSIGKTASKLTEAEINQAYLTRTISASEPFVGAMDGYLESLAGKQDLYSQAMKNTQTSYTEALEPVFSDFISMGTGILQILNEIISAHPNLTAGFTTFAVTLTSLVLVFATVKKAIDIYKVSTFAATIATKGFTAALASNPLGAVAVAISLVVGALVSLTEAEREQAEAQAKLNEQTDRYNKIKAGTYGYTDDAIKQAEDDKANIEEQIANIQKYIEAKEKLEQLRQSEATYSYKNGYTLTDGTLLSGEEFSKQYNETENIIKSLEKEMKQYGNTLDDIKNKEQELIEQQEAYQKQIDNGNVVKNISKSLDVDTIKNEQKQAAQLKVNTSTMQKYLDICKKGKTDTTEYQNALKALAEEYPEAASAAGLNEKAVQGLIDAEKLQADEAWNASQESIQAHIANIQAALNDEAVQKQVAENMGIAYDESFKTKLENILALLQTIGGYTPESVPNITPTAITAPSTSSSYSNEALDNYKRQIEHKKALDKITLREEIAMYETALRHYAITSEEKMELREQIYDLNKELAQKEKEILEQQTEDYEVYIQEQKNLRGAAYDITEQTRDYDRIISMHRSYLNQIMGDERLSLEERKEIYREELQIIRDYEQQKRDLRVEAVDNTVSQLTDALTKQLEELQEKDKEAIDKNLEEVEKWKNARIEAINEEYDARLEAINKELDLLNKSEEEKTRAEEDAEYKRKKLRLEQLIDYEHDATTKSNYQKELDKLIAEYEETLNDRVLEDKKEALNQQKDLLQQEQEEKTEAIEEEADKQKQLYEKQLEELEKYYDEQIAKSQETAEKMLLNVEQNHDKIIDLLKSYSDKYELTGQSLGEKLAQGINDGVLNQIQNIVQKIQDTIDSNLNAKIQEWTSSNYRYEEGQTKPISQSITINQTNNIEQNPELPSETYRKLNDISRNLASELSGM